MSSIKSEILELLEQKEEYFHYNQMKAMFPDEGPYSRDKYKAHIEFINKSSLHSQLAFIAANRTGKTKTGAYVMACHLTGDYPEWWEGVKFKNAISAWCSGKTNQKTREIVQDALLGPEHDIGSGLIPRDAIVKLVRKPGAGGAVETVTVRHVSGGSSILGFKSYEQGRDGFEGTKQQVIWLDEEPKDPSIYSECIMRLMDEQRPGVIYCTFTPLYGQSDVVLSFLPGGRFPINGVNPNSPDKFVAQCTWDDVPHISDSDKKRMWEEALPHERLARSKGIPSVGAGCIYPYDEDELVVSPFSIPEWWPRVYGLDVGWKRTAAVWLAQNPDTCEVFVYSEHYQAEGVPAIHASAIKGRGDWIEGLIDPASRTPGQADGKNLLDLYTQEGLLLTLADHAVEAGIFKVSQMFASGQLKIFNTCQELINEFRSYGRDENGKIIKKKDHALDALRYAIMSGLTMMRTNPNLDEDSNEKSINYDLGRDKITGY